MIYRELVCTGEPVSPGCCWFQSAKAAWPVMTWGLGAAGVSEEWAVSEETKGTQSTAETPSKRGNLKKMLIEPLMGNVFHSG